MIKNNLHFFKRNVKNIAYNQKQTVIYSKEIKISWVTRILRSNCQKKKIVRFLQNNRRPEITKTLQSKVRIRNIHHKGKGRSGVFEGKGESVRFVFDRKKPSERGTCKTGDQSRWPCLYFHRRQRTSEFLMNRMSSNNLRKYECQEAT